MSNDQLSMWTVYAGPSDYPRHFVARKFLVGEKGGIPTNEMFLGDTLAEVRELIPPGLYCIPRTIDDDKTIVETWL